MGIQGEDAVLASVPAKVKKDANAVPSAMTSAVTSTVASGVGSAVTSGLRLLVVDDSPYVLRAACSLLDTMPLIGEVVTASSGRAALELSAPGAFDVVLLDLSMDGLNGLDVARELRRRPGAPRIIMMSLYDEPEFAAAALAAGADVLVHKPSLGVQLEGLLAALFSR